MAGERLIELAAIPAILFKSYPEGGIQLSKIDDEGVEWLSEDDLAQMKSCADESTFNAFVVSVGGQRIDTLHPNLTFLNADYIFPDEKIIIELKTLETEVHKTDQFR